MDPSRRALWYGVIFMAGGGMSESDAEKEAIIAKQY
jgi:hypothetical protein